MAIGRVPGETGIQPSIVTAKGDLIVATANGSVTNQAVGTNNQVLMADSAQADGVKWANEATSTLTTTGDMLYASAANTLARRAIGSTGDVLTVSGGLPTWAAPSSGGMTLISTTTLTGASVTLSSIPQTYINLYLVIQNFKPSVDNAKGQIRINADSTANRHKFMRSDGVMDGSTATSFDDTSIRFMGQNDNTVANGLNTILFHNYTNTATWKLATISGATVDGTTTTSLQPIFGLGIYNQTSAITSLVLLPESGNFTSGTALLYGVK